MTDEDTVYELDIETFIEKLTLGKKTPLKRLDLDSKEVQAVCYIIRQVFKEENMLLEVDAPIKVCGDIHGQYIDLLRLLDLAGHPPQTRYLFLGDYVDRGMQSLETICLLFAYKLKFPDHIFMLRGNHESELINRVYGFRTEIKERFGSTKVWKSFTKVFNHMPIAAVIEDSIFCCHGGISPELLKPDVATLQDAINKIQRPCEVPQGGLMCDILWSDPADSKGGDPTGFLTNKRGCSYTFGYDVIEYFLEKFELDLIIRGHQVVEDGYEFYCNRKLVTVFSAPNYCGEFDNAAGIFCLDKKNTASGTRDMSNLEGGFQILKPDKSIGNQWYKNLKKKSKKSLKDNDD